MRLIITRKDLLKCRISQFFSLQESYYKNFTADIQWPKIHIGLKKEKVVKKKQEKKCLSLWKFNCKQLYLNKKDHV